MSLATEHLATLLRYAGISFIAGAVNHGFFSGERSLATAVLGVVAYLAGAVLERRAMPDPPRWVDLLGVGIVASIGLGFFTGGLQHFPDSPARSAWVVPLGFAMSVVAFRMARARDGAPVRGFVPYALVTGVVLTAGSVAAWKLYDLGILEAAPHSHGEQAAHDHDHDHDHGAAADRPASAGAASGAGPGADAGAAAGAGAAGGPATAAVLEVRVEMDDAMRFTPSRIEVAAGQPVRFVVANVGRATHELVIGTERELAAHAAEMRRGGAHHHGDASVRVKPGRTATLRRTFTEPAELGIACFEPGHYEAGMRGTLVVRPRS
ncbi:MAG: hypothetical protein RJA99_3657 [Pseudomonadota bacterium]|jgi:uncharacterized cupredoxin-like copper-binding protein